MSTNWKTSNEEGQPKVPLLTPASPCNIQDSPGCASRPALAQPVPARCSLPFRPRAPLRTRFLAQQLQRGTGHQYLGRAFAGGHHLREGAAWQAVACALSSLDLRALQPSHRALARLQPCAC